MKVDRRAGGGFTLLEILVVVIIVAIIAAAVIPLLGTYTDKARTAISFADARVIENAIARYNLAHQTPLGTVRAATGGAVSFFLGSSGDPEVALWDQLLQPTDGNGNPMNDPAHAGAGPFIHGPYLQNKPRPSSLLLGAPERAPSAQSAVLLFFARSAGPATGTQPGIGRVRGQAVQAQGGAKTFDLCAWPVAVHGPCGASGWQDRGSQLHGAPFSSVFDTSQARSMVGPVAGESSRNGPFTVGVGYKYCFDGPTCRLQRVRVRVSRSRPVESDDPEMSAIGSDHVDLLQEIMDDVCGSTGVDCNGVPASQ